MDSGGTTVIEELLSDPETGPVMRRCRRSLKAFCKYFMPDIFTAPFSKKIHDPMFELLEDRTKRLKAVAAPRGSGKTKLFLAWVVWRIVFGDAKYVVLVSCSLEKAIELLSDVKKILVENEQIRAVFGDLEGSVWTKETSVTSTGVKIVAKGAGSQIRGMVEGAARPDTIGIDDFEDPTEVRNENLRKENRRWLNSDLLPCVGLTNKNYAVGFFGTILHPDAVLEGLLSRGGFDPEDLAGMDIDPNDVRGQAWHGLRLELCDEKFNSNWPETITSSQLRLIYLRCKRDGDVGQFFREYRSLAVPSDEDASFRQTDFQYYSESSREFEESLKRIETIIIVDPAKSANKFSDLSAIVAIGIDSRQGRFYVRECMSEHLHPDGLINETFAMAKRYRARVIGLEVTSLKEFITHPFQNEMRRQGLQYEIIELNPRGTAGTSSQQRRSFMGKEQRLGLLSSFYRRKQMFHAQGRCHGLEQQLLAFPNSPNDDLHDAVSYVPQMMEMGYRYFEPLEYAESPEDIEKEFADLSEGEDMAELDMEEMALV